MSIITVTLPNPTNIAKGLAISTVIGKTFPNGKPLPVVLDKSNLHIDNSYLGVPALTELTIVDGKQSYVLNDCIMTVNQEKEIETTIVQGRTGGTVKEFIADGDYAISVQAAIAGDYLLSTNQNYTASDGYPIDEIKLFMKLLKKPQALIVTSDWLELFGVRSVVIKSYSFAQETHSNRQNFTMELLSDEPYEIKLLKDV
jgi:hypothetical protein